MNSTTTQPLYFPIDTEEIIGHDNLVFMAFVSKEYRLKRAEDVENHPRISRELSRRWRLVDTHRLYFKETKVVYDLEIRKYKSSWTLITKSKSDNQLILLKLIKQKVQKITHPCFTGKCSHIDSVI
jgi:hypothetical protein